MLSPAELLSYFSSPQASDISCEFLIWETEQEQECIWPPEGRSLHKRFSPCWLCLYQGPGHCRVINIWYAMSYWLLILLEWQFCVKPLPCLYCAFEMWPIWGQRWQRRSSDWDEAWRLWRCCSVQHFVPCLTAVAILLQVNFERRHPSFTRSLKRNAKWRTVRRPME